MLRKLELKIDFEDNHAVRLYSYDRLFYSLYGYDGGTTRTYKYSFDLNPNWVNGRLEAVNFNMHNAMFYPNSYLNFNNDGHYTKHYYNGMERIASRLGDQNLPINVNDPELQDRKDWQDSLIRKNIVEITGYEFLEPGQEQDPDDPKPEFALPQVGITGLLPSADGIYYYHSNHLGSTCYVTDENAIVQQGFLYAPFGEITNEYNNSFGSSVLPKYSFNAKELDEETGMYYYEARYYQPPTFTSRDALFEEKPWLTPYGYCRNNPVIYIDPSGNDEWQLNTENGKFTKVGNNGGSNTDYYSVGTNDKDGNFQESSKYVINRDKKCNINSFRIKESTNSTLSAFHIPDAKDGEISSGFFLERSGPDTKESNQSKRIPADSYGLTKNYAIDTKYPNSPRLYLESEKSSKGYGKFGDRGILIHVGNYYYDGVGCLLPGSSYGKKNKDYTVSNSRNTVNSIIDICKNRGWDNMRINICNCFK